MAMKLKDKIVFVLSMVLMDLCYLKNASLVLKALIVVDIVILIKLLGFP